MTRQQTIREIQFHVKEGKSFEELLGIYPEVPQSVLKIFYNFINSKGD